jgi:PiT family inorganic phosphate transporter
MFIPKKSKTFGRLVELASLAKESAEVLKNVANDLYRLGVGCSALKTLGMRMAPLGTEQGFAAETSAAGVLQLASTLGIPISTTHTITSAIVGVGVAKRLTSVRWGIAIDIALSWLLTLPATILFGWLFSRALAAVFATL